MPEKYDPCLKAVYFLKQDIVSDQKVYGVLFPFWSRGKRKAHFLRAVHIAKSIHFWFQFQRWEGVKRADLTR